jgi:hypothetical protein
MKYLLTLLILTLTLNFLDLEGVFYLNKDKVYWNRFSNAIGMISSNNCVWFNGEVVEECNYYTRNYLEIKQLEYEELY